MHKNHYRVAVYAAHTTSYNTHLLTAQKQTNNTSYTKEPTFRNMEVSGIRSQENGPKAEKDKTERATGRVSRTREEI